MALFLVLFIVLILFSFFFSLVSNVLSWLFPRRRKETGDSSYHRQQQNNEDSANWNRRSSPSGRKRLFRDDEGEYVDYEEIK